MDLKQRAQTMEGERESRNPFLVLIHAHDYVWRNRCGMSARELYHTLHLLSSKAIEVSVPMGVTR